MSHVWARRLSLALLALGGAVSLALVFISDGALLVSLMPLVAAGLALAVLWAPPRKTALALLFLTLAVESPQDHPMDGLWHSPLFQVGHWLFHNLSQNVPVPQLVFSPLDASIALLALAVLLRARHTPPLAAPIRAGLFLFAATLAVLFVLGVGHGGSFQAAYWQIRQLALLPVIAWVLSRALDVRRDLRAVVRVVFAGAFVKLGFGFYFYYCVARPLGLHPADITSHSDTLLFCACVAMCLFGWLEAPTRSQLRAALTIIPVLLLGIYLNNRRLAYAGLVAIVLIAFAAAIRRRGARRLIRLGLLLLPLVALYAWSGWSTKATWARPVAAFKTMLGHGDLRSEASASTLSREIEDYNLAATLREHPLGVGLGHPYHELIRGPDISELFELYLYIPHNMLLGLLLAGGPFGFFGLWGLLAVTLFLAARIHRCARSPLQRVTGLTGIAVVLLYVLQTYGDMGTQNWVTTWIFACTVTLVGQLAPQVGAWSERVATARLEPALA